MNEVELGGWGTCCWKGCEEEGRPRSTVLTVAAPKLGEGVAVLASFSDDAILCDRHVQALEAKVLEILTEELGEEGDEDGQDEAGDR